MALASITIVPVFKNCLRDLFICFRRLLAHGKP
jgi:hypothetical protein